MARSCRKRQQPQNIRRSPSSTASRGETSSLPSTVWAPTEATPPDAPWPTALLEQVIETLTKPGEQVALLPWPSHHTDPSEPAFSRAAETVQQLGRHPHLASPGSTSHRDEPSSPLPTVDLALTHCPPAASNEAACHNFGALAAQLLGPDGVVAVLTHTDTTGGTLTDPTGPIVTAAQDADLLYLQHVVLLLAPIHDGTLTPAEQPTTTTGTAPHGAHQRVHADLLLFTNPTTQI